MSERFFRVFTGLLTSEHKKRIGSSLWTFLWLIDRITDETVDEDTGQRTGLVLYGNITPYSTIGNDLGMSKSTVKEQCEKLQSEGYISMEQTPRGNKFHVNRSKKWKDPLKDRAENRTNRSDNQTKRAENGTTEKGDRAENRTEGAENRTKRSETPLSNTNIDILKEKDITTTQERKSVENIILEMNNDDHLTDFERLENRYIELRAKGTSISPTDIQAISETVEQVPYDAAAYFMTKCFEDRKGTSINSFRYCQKYIANQYQKHVEREKAMEKEKNKKVVPFQQPSTMIFDESTDERKLADLLLRKIIQDQDDFTKPDIQKWAFLFHSMLAEGKAAKHIQDAIVFARKNTFWKTKVLSPDDLKRFYDRLRAQTKAEQSPNAGKRNQHVADLPKWMTEEDYETKKVESNSSDDGLEELQAALEERKRRKEERELKNGSY